MIKKEKNSKDKSVFGSFDSTPHACKICFLRTILELHKDWLPHDRDYRSLCNLLETMHEKFFVLIWGVPHDHRIKDYKQNG